MSSKERVILRLIKKLFLKIFYKLIVSKYNKWNNIIKIIKLYEQSKEVKELCELIEKGGSIPNSALNIVKETILRYRNEVDERIRERIDTEFGIDSQKSLEILEGRLNK